MTLYKYQAHDKEGKLYERKIEAPDRLAIYGIIRDEGGKVVKIKEIKSTKLTFTTPSFIGGIKTQEKINFAKNLASMIDAGLSVTRALGVMSKQAKNKTFKTLLLSLEDDVNHGLPLSEALGKRSKVFSTLFVSMVKAGEESGSIAASLKIVANQLEKSYLLIKKVRGALIYPTVILGVMIVLAVLLLIYMVPTLTSTFSGLGVELPLATRIVIGISDFLISHTLLVFAAVLTLIFFLVLFWRSRLGRNTFDQVSLRIPVVGEMVREVQVARTTRTLSSLLSSGVDVVAALQITHDVLQSHLYKNVLKEAESGIQKGELMSQIFSRHENLYPVFVGEMTAVGEETGKISEMLMGIASYYEDDVDQKTKDLSTIIEPVLMIIIGIGVGVFAISMLAPTYSLVDYI